jgi:uncharacterized protein (DUF2147 family)
MKRTIFALAGWLSLGAGAFAAGDAIVGDWQRTDGQARIHMAPCGDGICGHLTWLKNPNSSAKVGQRVFYALKPAGAGWVGEAFNPEDGKTYSGKVSLSGSQMTTYGCVFGGLICKSVTWTRLD